MTTHQSKEQRMDKDKTEGDVFEAIEGLTPIDPNSLADFQRAMNEEVIPEIIKVVEERRMLAAESRQWQLKY
jgi:hypothetical protein